VAGNDRWGEHVVRALQVWLRGGLSAGLDKRPPEGLTTDWSLDYHWSSGQRRGFPDSWYASERGRFWSFTGVKAARYHFVPNFEGEDSARPVWRLEARFDDEGYTPPYGTFHELHPQIARFRRTDSPDDVIQIA